MVAADETKAHLHRGEVNTSLSTDRNLEIHHPKDTASNAEDNRGTNYAFPALSIYSLTLDEFQHTLCESGKNFGSMNMDDFLNSIWSAEENQAAHNPGQNHVPTNANNVSDSRGNDSSFATASSSGKCIEKQPGLQRQGSLLALPPPLSRKTVDEVWSEIQRNQQQQMQPNSAVPESSTSSHQPELTLGEMTLEDFLVKAGVVRALSHPPPPSPLPQLQQHQYGLYPNANILHAACTYGGRTLMGMAARGVPAYAAPMPSNSGIFCEPSAKVNNGYPAPQSTALCYGSRVGNGGASAGAYGQGLALGSPVSPLSSDHGLCAPSQVENSPSPYGFDEGNLRGRKRPTDSPAEKVVDRRQRRMIKNRESAARSRARKQAYTVELEAELNQLREENAQFKQALADLEMQRKQQHLEEQQKMAQVRAQKALEKLSLERRGRSCHM